VLVALEDNTRLLIEGPDGVLREIKIQKDHAMVYSRYGEPLARVRRVRRLDPRPLLVSQVPTPCRACLR
jgi:hypothetical protein